MASLAWEDNTLRVYQDRECAACGEKTATKYDSIIRAFLCKDHYRHPNAEDMIFSRQMGPSIHNNDEITTNEQGGKQSKLEYAYELLEPSWLRDVAHVLYTGKLKYGPKNWQLLTDYREHLGRAMYHIQQAMEDKDHSEMHFANATCRLMFADWCYKRQSGTAFIPINYWNEIPAQPMSYCGSCGHNSEFHVHVSKYNDATGKGDSDTVSCVECGCQQKQPATLETVLVPGPSIHASKDQDIELHRRPYGLEQADSLLAEPEQTASQPLDSQSEQH